MGEIAGKGMMVPGSAFWPPEASSASRRKTGSGLANWRRRSSKASGLGPDGFGARRRPRMPYSSGSFQLGRELLDLL
jgi:hypothetical protein